jgi:predicted TIM-barrel fold metal-dependent hydrolase
VNIVTTDTHGAIDAWAQPAFKQFFQHVPEIVRLFQQSKTAHILQTGVTVEEMVALMDKAGIETAMLCAWHRPGRFIVSNDDVAAIVQQFPKRFAGVAAVNLENPVEAVRQLEHAVRNLGFKALRVVPWLWNRPPNDKLYFPLYVKCIELGIPFCTQVGHTGPLMPSETGRPIPYLDEVALTFPQLKIVAGHIGFPWTDEMIGLAWKHENVFIDTSAYLPRHYPPQLVQYMKTYGKDKVLFGTNFPQLPFDSCIEQVRELDLLEPQRFLRDNARRVFQLD